MCNFHARKIAGIIFPVRGKRFSEAAFTYLCMYKEIWSFLETLPDFAASENVQVKGTASPDFVEPFSACTNMSGREKELPLVFKFFCHSFYFWRLF